MLNFLKKVRRANTLISKFLFKMTLMGKFIAGLLMRGRDLWVAKRNLAEAKAGFFITTSESEVLIWGLILLLLIFSLNSANMLELVIL